MSLSCMASSGGAASFAEWLDEFQLVYNDPTRLRDPCPNCKNSQLNLAFTNVDRVSLIGQVAFWCDHCLVGLFFGRSDARQEFPVYWSDDARPAPIPNYRIVPPGNLGDEDAESGEPIVTI